jgi:hypothetical protein
VIFSNYLVSGSFRVFKSKHEKLIQYVNEYKLNFPDHQIIHVGTKNDKLNDKENYSIIDIDLRGETNIDELKQIIKLDEVILYIGFDNFIMHLFFILNKDVKILSRGRWTNKSRFFLENFIDPPYDINLYSGDKQYIR